jgi:quercetin dioxygenase-like cupin family protein
MRDTFPLPVTNLPEADIPLKGVRAYLCQAKNHQIIFMEFAEDTDVPAHSHESQWEIVLEGKVELSIDGAKQTYAKGDRFFIPNGVKHSASVFAGYTAIAFFNQADRYKVKLR